MKEIWLSILFKVAFSDFLTFIYCLFLLSKLNKLLFLKRGEVSTFFLLGTYLLSNFKVFSNYGQVFLFKERFQSSYHERFLRNLIDKSRLRLYSGSDRFSLLLAFKTVSKFLPDWFERLQPYIMSLWIFRRIVLKLGPIYFKNHNLIKRTFFYYYLIDKDFLVL